MPDMPRRIQRQGMMHSRIDLRNVCQRSAGGSQNLHRDINIFCCSISTLAAIVEAPGIDMVRRIHSKGMLPTPTGGNEIDVNRIANGIKDLNAVRNGPVIITRTAAKLTC